MALATLPVPSARECTRGSLIVEQPTSLHPPFQRTRAPSYPKLQRDGRCYPVTQRAKAGRKGHPSVTALPGGGHGGRGTPPGGAGSGGREEPEEEPEGDGSSETPWAWLISGVAVTVGLGWAVKRRLTKQDGVQTLDT